MPQIMEMVGKARVIVKYRFRFQQLYTGAATAVIIANYRYDFFTKSEQQQSNLYPIVGLCYAAI